MNTTHATWVYTLALGALLPAWLHADDDASKQLNTTLAMYQTMLTYAPNNADTHYRIGHLLCRLERYDESCTHLQNAIELQPKHISALLELANICTMLDQSEKSLELYQRVLELLPNARAPLYNYGYTLKRLGRFQEAIEVYNKVIDQEPDYALAHFGRAVSYLTLGDFEHGWPDYEWRWKAYDEPLPVYEQPRWDGSDPAGKRILMYAEQGLGDTLQFIRYAQLLKERGAYVIFQAQKPLKTLLSRCDYLDVVIAPHDVIPPFDVHIPLMSLPFLCGTRLATVPASIPYITADPELVALWKQYLDKDPNFKIGICWQGNAFYTNQFLRQAVAAKSMTVHTFAPIGRLPGVSLYSLQKISGTEQLATLEGFSVHEFGPDFDESHGRFMDTAAVICNLDLIITVDTSIAHLAAALRKPVWMPLPQPADWRWMLERADTPWYPNMRLFRQTTPGDWESVMMHIANDIKGILCFGKK